MIEASALKPHLLHEDRLVRDAVVVYFEKSWSRDPELVPQALEARARFGEEATRRMLRACERFVLTPESLEAVIGALGEARDRSTAMQLCRVIAHAPPELLSGARERILAEKNLSSQTRIRLHRRIQIGRWPAKRLWGVLTRLAKHSKHRHAGEIDHGHADDLIDALARLEEPSRQELCELIASEADWGWLEIFAIDLAGARGIREAVPALVDKFHIDTDYMLERVSRALARIGDPSAVERIRKVFPTASWNFQNFSAGVLSDIKSAESEEALLALLDIEQDPSIRVWLCLGLCEQFSERGLPVVLAEIRRGYEPGLASLEEASLPVAELLGVGIPEADAWRDALERERERLHERMRQLEEWGRSGRVAQQADPFATLRDALATDPLGDPLDDELGDDFADEPRIASNAPCPCGSGIEFERCCGREA